MPLLMRKVQSSEKFGMKDGQRGQREGMAKLPGENVQAVDDRTRTQYMVEDK